MKCWPLIIAVIAVLAVPASPSARAQINLPQVQVPGLPQVGGVLNDTVNRATNDPVVARTLRATRVRDLIRSNRQVLEADPQGAPILRSEVVAISPTAAALAHAMDIGFSVARRTTLEGLELEVVILKAPEGMSTRRALKKLRADDPEGVYDYNHVYLESGLSSEPPSSSAPISQGESAAAVPAATRVGLIDSGVDLTHPAFQAVKILSHGCSGKSVPDTHGTAVASLMVGQAGNFRGAAVGATLYTADVYCGVPSGGAVDAIVSALAWMARERVAVVNVSLVGPPNALLENVTRTLVARGHLLVAAVGNDGPAAKPLYPAAYPGVVGVTAVDARQRVLLEACRGQQVDLAAPGADIAGAVPGGTFGKLRGTSFAAPIVSSLLASRLGAPDSAGAAQALQQLTAAAQDLGSQGRDNTYGAGLVGDSLRPQFPAVLAGDKSNH